MLYIMEALKQLRCIILSVSKEISQETGKLFCDKVDDDGLLSVCFENVVVKSIVDWIGSNQGLHVADAIIIRVRSTEDWIILREYVKEKNLIQFKILIYDEDIESIVEDINPSLKFHWGDKTKEEIVQDIIKMDAELESFLIKIFSKIDLNGDGYIDFMEMETICRESGIDVTVSEFEEALSSLDRDLDNRISYSEFSDWFKKGRQCSKLMKNIIGMKLLTSNLVDKIVNSKAIEFLKEQIDITQKELKETISSYFAVHIEKLTRDPEIKFICRGYFGGEEKEQESRSYVDSFPEGLKSNDFFVVLEFKVKDSEKLEYMQKFLNSLTVYLKEFLIHVSKYRFTSFNSNMSAMVIKKDEQTLCLSIKLKRVYKEELASFENSMKMLLDKDITQTLYFNLVAQGDFENAKKNPKSSFIDTVNLCSSLELKTNILKKNWKVLASYLKSIVPSWMKIWINSFGGSHLELNFNLDYLKSQEKCIYKESNEEVIAFIKEKLIDIIKSFFYQFGGLNKFTKFFDSVKNDFELIINTPHIFTSIKLDYDKVDL